MPFCILYIIVTYRNGRGFAETGKKVKKKNLHEREENGGQHVARSGRQALGREKTGKTDCCGQRHHGASLTRSPGRQYLRLNHCRDRLRVRGKAHAKAQSMQGLEGCLYRPLVLSMRC